MTQSGLILLPLFLMLLVLPRVWAIPALYIGAVFADASIANLGGRPIPVPWFVGLLVIARELWVIALGGNQLRLDVLQRLVPLVVFALACCLSLILALALFQNKMMVLPGSAGFNPALVEPFHLMPENINQLVYMGLIVVLVTLIANLAADLEATNVSCWVDRGMRWSCAVATLAVVWHVASFSVGAWFPEQFFHSSIKAGAWAQGGFGDLTHRPSGSFSEPSELAYYYIMLVFYFFQQWRLRGWIGDQIFLTISFGVLVISTSTTAYLLIAVFAGLAVTDYALGRSSRLPVPLAGHRRRGLRGVHIVALLVIAGAIGAGAWLFHRNQSIIQTVYQEQLVEKSQSRSYGERSTADQMAWRIFIDTYGIGAGLGSHRPNSGLMTVVSGSGLLGGLAVIWFLLCNLSRPGEGAFDRAAESDLSKPMRWAALGLLLGHVISGPDVQSILLWTSLALALAFHIERRVTSPPTTVTAMAGRRLGVPS